MEDEKVPRILNVLNVTGDTPEEIGRKVTEILKGFTSECHPRDEGEAEGELEPQVLNLGGDVQEQVQVPMPTLVKYVQDYNKRLAEKNYRDLHKHLVGELGGDTSPEVIEALEFDIEMGQKALLILGTGAIKASLATAITLGVQMVRDGLI